MSFAPARARAAFVAASLLKPRRSPAPARALHRLPTPVRAMSDAAPPTEAAAAPAAAAPAADASPADDGPAFLKLDVRVGKILSVEVHPDADG